MGEHEKNSISATGLFFSGIMRNSRGKLFIYVAILGTFFVIMFIFSRTHSNLKELEGVNQRCQQQRDSLSAQLQVVYEHKSRLEKSLHQETSDHTHTKNECDTQHREMERKQQQDKDKIQSLEKQQSELRSSYSQLDEEKKLLEKKSQDQLQSLQNQKDEEIQRLQTQLNDLLLEKEKLEQSNDAYEMKLQQQMGELNMCLMRHEQMELKLNSANEQMKRLHAQVPLAELPDEAKKQKTEPSKGSIMDVHVKERNGLSNVSFHKDKEVLMRPNLLPPDVKKASMGGSNLISKYLKSIPGNSVDHHGSIKHEGHENAGVNVDGDAMQRNDAIQDQEDNKIIQETNEINIGGGKLFNQEPMNHPQVQPPHHFEDPGERGELLQQNGADEQKPQLEQPFNKANHLSNDIKKSNGLGNGLGNLLQLNNGLAVPHLQGVGDKEDYGNQHNVVLVKRDSHVKEKLGDNGVGERKQYGEDDDDDQDGEHDEDQMMGGGPALRGRQFQDADFDDQDNAENENGAREEEGVVVAPK